MNTHVRLSEPSDDHQGTSKLPPLPTAPAMAQTCEVCARPVLTRKPARCCSARCRAEASRRRRSEADRARLDEAEAALRAALRVVSELRADLGQRGAA